MATTLVLGIGNPILSDDGVGIHVMRKLQKHVDDPGVVFEEAAVGGMALLDMIVGYERVVMIDAIQLSDMKPGELRKMMLDDFAETVHSSSPHDVNFFTAIEMGKSYYGDRMPKEYIIYAIQADNILDFSEEMTPAVAAAVPGIVETIVKDMGWGVGSGE